MKKIKNCRKECNILFKYQILLRFLNVCLLDQKCLKYSKNYVKYVKC